jgi:drug/metabolite transporter (DMT)-like permease
MATLEATAPAPAERERALALVAALVTVSLWASAFVGIRSASRQLSPEALALGRLTIASVGLGLLVLVRREPLPSRRDLPAIAFCGVSWFGLYNIVLNEAERRVDAGTAAMLVNVGPIVIAVLAGFVLHEGFPRRLLAGCAVAFAGAIVIGSATSKHGLVPSWSALLCVAAAVFCRSAARSCVSCRTRTRRRSGGWSTSRSHRWPSAFSPGATRSLGPPQAGWARRRIS